MIFVSIILRNIKEENKEKQDIKSSLLQPEKDNYKSII